MLQCPKCASVSKFFFESNNYTDLLPQNRLIEKNILLMYITANLMLNGCILAYHQLILKKYGVTNRHRKLLLLYIVQRGLTLDRTNFVKSKEFVFEESFEKLYCVEILKFTKK